jgi:fused signal recognition particle receptor
MGILQKLGLKSKQDIDQGLEKTREGILGKLEKIIKGKDYIDDSLLDDLEELFISSDVGVPTTLKIIQALQENVRKNKFTSVDELTEILKQIILERLKDQEEHRPAQFDAVFTHKPQVILIVGVNGVGKTTTIGKLASLYGQAGKTVMLGAADTFRAAAVSQLSIWGERSGAVVIEQGQGADPASVAFSAVQSAVAKGVDVLLIDTAGRLHNKVTLMNELTKIKRVISKVIPEAPHEVILVLDASTGQNALQQAKAFSQAVEITGLAVTKLDGTAKGGIVLAISDELDIPVKYIGLGEKIEDLQVFDRKAYVEGLFGKLAV